MVFVPVLVVMDVHANRIQIVKVATVTIISVNRVLFRIILINMNLTKGIQALHMKML